jgi:uncharacterized membrane protein
LAAGVLPARLHLRKQAGGKEGHQESGKGQMLWNRKYIIKSYIKSSLWPVPFVSLLLYWVTSRLTHKIGAWLLQTGRIDASTAFFGLSLSGAKAVLEAIVTANLSFLVFTFGSLLVAIQVASGQYTPRIIATTLLKDNPIRFTVGYFLFTLLFALRVLMRMDDAIVHQFNTFIAVALGLGSVVIFLYLIDHAARFLRPVSIVYRVGQAGLAVIRSVYPKEAPARPKVAFPSLSDIPDRVVSNAGTSGVVLAFDLGGLVTQAQQANGIIEIRPEVGNFVAVGEPLLKLYAGAVKIDDRQLRGAVALGSERTLEQDPTFAFRILVDIAIKALSPAINDPTTAVVAIDQLHRLLRLVGQRHVKNDRFYDGIGHLRVIYRTPDWRDFVHLACTEIRHCGAGSIQIARRMRSMLENLMATLPQHRHPELQLQLVLLDQAIDAHYSSEADRELARIADSQGLGGTLGINPTRTELIKKENLSRT